jgi:hypothetical protein
MRDGNDIKGFQKVLSKLSTALTLAIQGAPLEENPWGSPPEPAGEQTPAEEETPESNERQRSFTVADLIAGDIPTVPEGHELKQVNTPSAPANNIEVTSYLSGCFVAGPGLPQRESPATLASHTRLSLRSGPAAGPSANDGSAPCRLHDAPRHFVQPPEPVREPVRNGMGRPAKPPLGLDRYGH